MRYWLLFAISILCITGCTTIKKPYIANTLVGWEAEPLPNWEISRVVYLLGNTGFEDTADAAPVFNMLQAHLNTENSDTNSTVLFLGDNIVPKGMPKKDNKHRIDAEQQILWQLNKLKDYKCQLYFIPGDKDWDGAGSDGVKAVKRQEDFLQDRIKDKDVFVPDNACGEVEVKKQGNDLVFLFIDSQWWLQHWDNDRKINKGCENQSRQAFLDEFKAEILDQKNKQIIVVMHHPLFSNGNRGGNFSAKQHFFPFTTKKPRLWIPMPALGSLYSYSRSTAGNQQDISNRNYYQLKNSILEIIDEYDDIVFVSSHEHNLQYFKQSGHHFIVSGSASKTDYAGPGGIADFVHEKKGFGKLVYFSNGALWLEFYTIDENNPEGKVAFRQELAPLQPDKQHDEVNTEKYTLPDSIVVVPEARYYGNKFKKFWRGEQYRDAWSTPIKVPIINLSTAFGGLTPGKKGGGFASTSIRLEAPNGKEYALRSIDKSVVKVLPEEYRHIKALNILQDQISAIHPFGAIIIPPLADAAGVYHTNPKVVYLKRQPRMGVYDSIIEEGLYLLEERPDGNWEDAPNFGSSKEIISSVDVILELQDNEKNKVDQQWVLKSRLFDLIIHDWDRHEDQWRWASYKQPGGTLYRPIPRDRDEAFYKFEGLVPTIVQVFAVKKFKSFKKDLKAVKWQSYNARNFDRYFLNQMTKEDWIASAKQLQQKLTNGVIDSALLVLPPEIYGFDAGDITTKLKGRRDNLEKIAIRLYDNLSKSVDITGTNRDDFFAVERKKNGDTQVRVYHRTGKGHEENPYYERLFLRKETKSINLFALNGDDIFELTGKGKKGILIRIIGGEGNDGVRDSSRVCGLIKKTKVFDLKRGIELEATTAETANKTSNNYDINEYDRERFDANEVFPLVGAGYNYDDGIFIGGGFIATTYRFRKAPYATKHWFNLIMATKAYAFSLDYTGDFTRLFGIFDGYLTVDLKNPDYVNYFGLGNSTIKTNDEDSRYNWLRMRRFTVAPQFKYSINDGVYDVRLGPIYESTAVVNVEGRIVDNPAAGITDEDIKLRHYAGMSANSVLTAVDNLIKPTSGYKHMVALTYLNEIGTPDRGFLRIHADFSNYMSFFAHKNFQVTLANRVGAATILGDYQFYHNPSMGVNTYLRGFRNERFRGQTLFFHNIDLRITLFNWNNSILPFEFGVNGGFDYGRVWQDKVTDKQYFHKGYTVGIWMSPLKFFAASAFVSFSKDEPYLINVKSGFYF
ncbi:metallophosphoesterase [soil metagenome]